MVGAVMEAAGIGVTDVPNAVGVVVEAAATGGGAVVASPLFNE